MVTKREVVEALDLSWALDGVSTFDDEIDDVQDKAVGYYADAVWDLLHGDGRAFGLDDELPEGWRG